MSDLSQTRHGDLGLSGVSVKVCGGCGRRVDESLVVGALYWCEWALRKVPVRIKRTPLWKDDPKEAGCV